MSSVAAVLSPSTGMANPAEPPPLLLRQLLEEQQALSAVEQFARSLQHGDELQHGNRHGETFDKAARYRSLLPAAPPAAGQQYAFEVDLDRCSGCKACVTACHNLNGLDSSEAWRDVGLLVGGTTALPVLQHVTTACHHCLSPACLTACPVNAYEKDPLTGIVRHLDDQCFGCQYCTLACPYDVPKYQPSKGIVRKCDMCSTRLAAGEAPACVQSCPSEAIAIRVVSVEQAVEDAEAATFLPAAPDPQITFPTTTYKSSRAWPRNMLPADYFQVNRQHPHWPLVLMLVLTQLSVGAFGWGIALDRLVGGESSGAVRPVQAVTAIVFGLVALAASVFHLGRPHLAFRAVLGLGHSWLSREILLFGLFAALACLYAGVLVMPERMAYLRPIAHVLGPGVAIAGAAALFCSVMIYTSLRREFWDFPRTAFRFTLTSLLLGLATLWLSLAALTAVQPTSANMALVSSTGPTICLLLIGLALFKLLGEALLFRHLLLRAMTPLKRSALLMTRDLASPTFARFALGVLGGIVAPALLWRLLTAGPIEPRQLEWAVATALLFGATLAGELLERYLFFAAAAPPRMPGGIR